MVLHSITLFGKIKFCLSARMMTSRDIQNLVENYIGTEAGYLKNFSYRTHDTFYHEYCDLDVDVPAYRWWPPSTLQPPS
jgi:hypothetical protein